MVAPCSGLPPWMIMPSAVSSTSAPMALKFSAMTAIRLDSLTFNSAASRMMVSPSAKQAMAAIIGSSSIRVGMMSPWMSVPCRLLVRTRMSATGSPVMRTFKRVRSPPMARQTWIIPSRVGLMPTFFMRSSELGIISPAARKKAAEEISPGTAISFANSSSAGRIMAVVFSVQTSAPNSFSISSVWLREREGSVTFVSPSA